METFAVWRRRGRLDVTEFGTIGVVTRLGGRIVWSRLPSAKFCGRGMDGAMETTDSSSSECSSGIGGIRFRSLVASATHGCARRHVGYSGSPVPINACKASRRLSMVSMRCSWVCQSIRFRLSIGCIHEAQVSDKSIKSSRRDANLSTSFGSSSCPNCFNVIALGSLCTRCWYTRMSSRDSEVGHELDEVRLLGGARNVHNMSRDSFRGDRPEYARAYSRCHRRNDAALHSCRASA